MKWYQKLGQWFIDGWNWLKGSADNKPGGSSSKKLTGFAAVMVATIITHKWAEWAQKTGDWSLLPAVLGLWFGFGAAALGINAWEKYKHVADGTKGTGEAS